MYVQTSLSASSPMPVCMAQVERREIAQSEPTTSLDSPVNLFHGAKSQQITAMSLQSDVFEPSVILGILKGLENSASAKETFEKNWKASVKKRIESWKKHKDNKSVPAFQLDWEAHIVEYVDYLHSRLAVHGNSSTSAKKIPRILHKSIPLLGPRFSPPTFLHYMRRDITPAIHPEYAYMKPLTVVHPVFFPILAQCPQCESSSEIRWDGWNGTGGRSVHGVRFNERTIGYQLRCKNCKTAAENATRTSSDSPDIGYCFATTNYEFWEKWEHWRIPRNIPIFRQRTAVTHELFDLIIELRLSSTAGGLEEHLKQLHLLEHKQRMLEYLSYFESARPNPFMRNNLQHFSPPINEEGYGDSFISNDLIKHLYLDFIAKVRQTESIEYCKTRTDNTFKSGGKATLVGKDGQRSNPLKGGILSAINEEGEGVAWRFCSSNSPAETRELLQGLGKRHEYLGLPKPSAVIVDNCCQVQRYVREGLGPDTAVVLDVYHFMMRYSTVIFNGTKNPHRAEVLVDIRDAIIKTPAIKNVPATYWTQPEQEANIIKAYDKWLKHGGIWTAASGKVHSDQLEHVRRGCLSRPREDIAMDGSRIEGSHKAWNSLQRAQPSGIEVYAGLAHDFFLRRNIRVGSSRIKNKRQINSSDFVASTHSSHHVQLVNHIAKLFNSLYEKEPTTSKNKLHKYPTLPSVPVDEMIGLVRSEHTLTFGGLISIKEEVPESETNILLDDLDSQIAEIDQARFNKMLGIDERLLSIQLGKPEVSITTTSSVSVSAVKTLSSATNPPTMALASASTLTPKPASSLVAPSSLKRKECAPHIATNSWASDIRSTDNLPNSKRRRHMALPGSSGVLELDSDDSTPEPDIASSNSMDAIDCEPLHTVKASDACISLPNNPSTNTPTLNTFFKIQSQKPSNTPPVQPAAQASSSKTTLSLEMLQRPLPKPTKFLTRSQVLFSIGTSVDPQELRIAEGDEFFLFMDMRAEFQWISYAMTGSKWAAATNVYNKRLDDLGKKKNLRFIKKNPRALVDKLNEVEAQINNRIIKENYRSQNGSESFWLKHCHSVAGFSKTESADELSQKKRKPAVCKRCKVIMYLKDGKPEDNHKRGVCADGVASVPKPCEIPEWAKYGDHADFIHPAWPQPEDLFSKGKYFHAAKFLFAVRNLYEKVLETTERSSGAPDQAGADYLSVEDRAFARMLKARTRLMDGHAYFLLYDLELIGGSYESLLSDSETEGLRYLRIDCL
ncbi:hypothetical protein BJ912DRAFT_930520 [Pholiota molesta]|nr:hypothetical protein BJ912DRAFT_930520 [Pholiota molesta]